MAETNGTDAGTARDGKGAGERLLTKPEVAEFCRVSQRSIDNWMRDGRIVFYRIGRTVRFRLSDVREHLDATCRVGGVR